MFSGNLKHLLIKTIFLIALDMISVWLLFENLIQCMDATWPTGKFHASWQLNCVTLTSIVLTVWILYLSPTRKDMCDAPTIFE